MISEEEAIASCLKELQSLDELFDKDGKCGNPELAQALLKNLKQEWRQRIAQLPDADAAIEMQNGLNRITVKTNSKPDGKWASELYAAGVALRFLVSSKQSSV